MTTVTGTLAGALGQSSMGCEAGLAAFSGPEVFYVLTLTEPRLVGISLTGILGTVEGGLVVAHGLCDELIQDACSSDRQHTGNVTLPLRVLRAGTYFIMVDSRTAGAGAFSLTVTSSPPPDGETCSTLIPLDASVRSLNVDGDLMGHANDTSLGCESGQTAPTGPDLFHSVTVEQPRVLTLTVNTNANAMELGIIRLSGACGSLSLATCSTDVARSGNVGLVPAIYNAGTYIVAVDSRFSSVNPVPFTLTVGSAPVPVGATCDLAIPVTLGETPQTLTGNLISHTSEIAPGCEAGVQALYGPEVFHSFTLDAAATVTASLTNLAPNSETGLVLLEGACASQTQLTCTTDRQRTGATSLSRALMAGTYTLVVESRFRTSDMPYTLELSAVP